MAIRFVCVVVAGIACGVSVLSAPLRAQVPASTIPAATAGPAPVTAGTPLAAGDLRADLSLVREAFTLLHPGLHRFRTPGEIDAAFAAADAEFNRDRTLAEAFLVFSRLAAEFRCGHAFCNPANQSKAVRAALIEPGPRVPFLFRWVGPRMIVVEALAPRDGTPPALAPGDEVVSINDMTAPDLLAAMLPLARADGSNDGKRLASLSVEGGYSLAAFDVLLPLVHAGVRDAGEFTLRVRGLEGTERTVVAGAQTHADRVALARTRAGDTRGSTPLWTLTRPRADAALLTMPTWAMYNSTWNWAAYLHGVFDDLVREGVPNLIIDLRANEGGNDVGHEVLARLSGTPVVLPPRQSIIAAPKVPDHLNPHLDTWDNSFRDRSAVSRPLGNGLHEIVPTGGPAAGTIAPRAPRYAGRVFVLIGPQCSSATFQFAHLVKRSGLATLVGQTTGGNQRGITGGNFFFLRLPRSGIELDLPLKTTPLDPALPDAGVEPDVRVDTTREHIAAVRDPELEAVYGLIDAARP